MARDRVLKGLVCERFVVSLKTGETFDGLLEQVDARLLVFVDGHAHTGDGQRVPADGRLYLDRADIAYMQRPGGTP